MLLRTVLFVSAYTIATTVAAVNFYGSERPDGDYVTCEVPDVSDEDVSSALSIFYFPGEVVPDSTDLKFDEELFCGDFASVAVEFACHDLGGEATCVPTESEGDDDAADDTDMEKVSQRSLTRLTKRSGAECDPYTLECKNQYQSTSASCSGDYKAETFEVSGNLPDTWCTKPCTKEEKKVCEDQVCGKGKEQCEKFGYVNDCAKALVKCAGSPVKMPEKSCTTKYLAPGFGNYCTKTKKTCVAYEEGSCQLDAAAYKAYADILMEAFGSMG